MNNRQVSSDVLAQKRQGLFDMLNGNATPAAQGFAQEGAMKNEQLDRKLGRVKSSSEATVSHQDYEKEIGSEVFDISSRMQQKVEQQPQYQQPQQQQPQYQQPQYQQPQYQQPQYQQPMTENYGQPQNVYGGQLAAPVSSDLIQNMLDGRNPRGPQQYAQPSPQPNYGSSAGMLNEETKRELANDIVERIKTSYLREEIMSVLMEDVFSTGRMNKILTENFERLLKSYLMKQAKAKNTTSSIKK